MEKWHITITNNETGAKEVDADTNAILAAVAESEETHSIGLVNCGSITYAATICGVMDLLAEQKQKHPEVAKMACDVLIANSEQPKTIKSIINTIFGRR